MFKVLSTGFSIAAAFLATSALAGPWRLPAGVAPRNYDITVQPDSQRLTFTGTQSIAIQVAKPTRTITLNAADLMIADVKSNGSIPGTVALAKVPGRDLPIVNSVQNAYFRTLYAPQHFEELRSNLATLGVDYQMRGGD